MRPATIILFLAIALCVNARVIKRQKKTRVLSKPSPACGCQITVLELPCTKSLLESTCGCLATGCPTTCSCPTPCSCPTTSTYGCLATNGCPITCSCPTPCVCPTTCSCPSPCGCPISNCGCQNIYLEELPCSRYNYGDCDSYGMNELSNCDRIPAIRLPKTLASIDARIPVPAINLPLYQDVPSCQCQNALPYQIIDSPCNCYDFLNPIDIPSSMIKMPVEMIQTVMIDVPRSVVKLPNCGCKLPEGCGCQRQKCGCLPALDTPCTCQLPTIGSPCGCQLSLDVPCGCQLPAFNLPCGYQLPSLDCGCQIQAFNSPCCPLGNPCGLTGQLPVPNVPCAYLLPSPDVPCAYQLPDVACNCQLPGCGCQSVPPGGCGKYLRQVTLQPPFL